MYYPLNLLNAGIEVFPLFGERLTGAPLVFDFSSANPEVDLFDTADFDSFQQRIFGRLAQAGATWGVGRYLEERGRLLSRYPQMAEEQRFYHVGLDIVVPAGWPLHAPLDGTVHALGRDAGLGNYGGYLVLRHELGGTVFYTLYGHLALPLELAQGDAIAAGQIIAQIGAGLDSGGWFTHTHLQVITARALSEGRMLQGYVTAADLRQIEDLFPSPYPLFRIRSRPGMF